ncbi:hypothetical protein M3P05_16905 [Sansalvadorimonas sp. 2012CJ34-2]|uniref:Uncharacterized protein n=1 Tax=Parendozoicomonas callyspongiae TaxID=2942213 RepID=A0ABT0PJU0_9GAMM|nr:hypothetical protein [Sansalvadorimonas sp. 2012CJ34-2]MCL6271598.1 hypothetical protein [Sansalvadorimonas sp. 2012CJ34-2]
MAEDELDQTHSLKIPYLLRIDMQQVLSVRSVTVITRYSFQIHQEKLVISPITLSKFVIRGIICAPTALQNIFEMKFLRIESVKLSAQGLGVIIE